MDTHGPSLERGFGACVLIHIQEFISVCVFNLGSSGVVRCKLNLFAINCQPMWIRISAAPGSGRSWGGGAGEMQKMRQRLYFSSSPHRAPPQKGKMLKENIGAQRTRCSPKQASASFIRLQTSPCITQQKSHYWPTTLSVTNAIRCRPCSQERCPPQEKRSREPQWICQTVKHPWPSRGLCFLFIIDEFFMEKVSILFPLSESDARLKKVVRHLSLVKSACFTSTVFSYDLVSGCG